MAACLFTSLVTAPTLRLVSKEKYMNRIQWQCWDYRKKSDRQRNVCLTDVCSALLFSVWWFGAEQSSLWPPYHSAQLSVNTLNTQTDRQSQTLRQVIVYAHEASSCIFRNAIQCKLLLLTVHGNYNLRIWQLSHATIQSSFHCALCEERTVHLHLTAGHTHSLSV